MAHRFTGVIRAVAVCALILQTPTLPSAQGRPAATPATPADAAARALAQGQYDEVDRLTRGASDPRMIAIHARADIERGRYAEAEKQLTAPAAAQPTSDAALELGLLRLELGRRDEGRRILDQLVERLQPRTAADYLRMGRAAQALGQSHDANGFYRSGNKVAPQDVAINTAWGRLFLEKYDPKEALKSFQDALKADESYLPAIVGYAELMLGEDPPKAKEALERALKINPASVPVHLLKAEIALDDRKRDDAKGEIKQALTVNPSSLEAKSLTAAIAFLEGKPQAMEQEIKGILAINPRYGEVYRVIGDHAARNYRFDEASVLVKRALEIDDQNTQAYADLGRHLLRTGDEPAARRALERAFKDDDFDQVTYNLLTLLDSLDKFETVTDGKFIVRFDPAEIGVMKEQAIPLAKEALATFEKKYNITVNGPILIEMFPKHDDFAVRNVGLPGMIGALGACFGRVVTLDSPHARPPGDFNWGATLWHELAHVVSLQLSNNRVPRWLTEGISVWEERRGRPEWGWEMEVPFAQAMDAGKIFKLNVLNEGFSDPEMISLAYHQASLVSEHLAKTYGEAGMTKLLQAYGRGLETDAAVKEAFNVTLDDIQKSFDAELERHYRPLITALKAPEVKGPLTLEDLKQLASSNPGSFRVQISLGRALAKADDSDGAIAAFERAAALVPWATGDDNPNKEIAKIALAKKDNARAITALEAVLKVDHADVEAARALVPLVAKAPPAQMENAYQRLVDVDPFEASAHAVLGRLAMQRRDGPAAVKAYRTALAINPPDRAAALVDLGEAYLLARQPAQARTQALAAMEIAPSFERAQDLLLKVVEGGRTEN